MKAVCFRCMSIVSSSSTPALIVPEGYDEFLRELKQRIREAQLRAVLAVNHELAFVLADRT